MVRKFPEGCPEVGGWMAREDDRKVPDGVLDHRWQGGMAQKGGMAE